MNKWINVMVKRNLKMNDHFFLAKSFDDLLSSFGSGELWPVRSQIVFENGIRNRFGESNLESNLALKAKQISYQIWRGCKFGASAKFAPPSGTKLGRQFGR